VFNTQFQSHAETEDRVVDNRVLVLGLDKLYRDAMKRFERTELLDCARRVAEALHARPADVPIEGYYGESLELTEYFLLMRALQEIGEEAISAVSSLQEFNRLREVTSAPIFGQPQYNGKLLAVGHDALSKALFDTFPEWTVKRLTDAAYASALEMDDISLVGLAARIRDAVVLTATRESVVLYAGLICGSAAAPPEPRYIWTVDEDVAAQASRFVDAFNGLFGEELWSPAPKHAAYFWHAYTDNDIVGRCVRIGCDDRVSPIRHYHWAICRGKYGPFAVDDFWKSEVWTTERYRSTGRRQGAQL
jgi:hypothetical protein